MRRIIQLAEEYLEHKQKSEALLPADDGIGEAERNQLYAEYDTLQQKVARFLAKAEKSLKHICSIYSKYGVSYAEKHVYYNGKLPVKTVPFDAISCFERADELAGELAGVVKKATTADLDFDDIKALVVYHFSLYQIAAKTEKLKEKRLESLSREKDSHRRALAEDAESHKAQLSDLSKQIKEAVAVYLAKGTGAHDRNKLYVGNHEDECSDAVKELLIAEYGLSYDDFLKCKLTLGLGPEDKNIAFFENARCKGTSQPFSKYLYNIYFKNATNFNSKLRVARVGGGTTSNLSDSLMAEIERPYTRKGKQEKLQSVVIELSKDDPFGNLLQLRNNQLTDIVAYNDTHPLSLKDYTVVFVDNFPACIDSSDKRNAFLELISDSKRTGFFFIINGQLGDKVYEYEVEYGQSANAFTPESFSRSHSATAVFDYRGGNTPGFPRYDEKVEEVKPKIASYNRKLQSFILSKQGKNLGALLDPNVGYESHDLGAGISIPVGYTDNGEVFQFCTDAKANPFALIVGNTGTGKTAFIHTLILSGALKYSPSELEYYIVDFKDSAGSADFDAYTYRKGEKNMYIPHVRYLSTKAGKDSAMDVLNLINRYASENLQVIRAAGCGNFAEYNSSEEVKSGRRKKLSQKYFIIDEYNSMLDENNIEAIEIEQKLQSILSRIRSSGVSIIFSGQKADALNADSFSRITTNIAFDLRNSTSGSLAAALNLSIGVNIQYEKEIECMNYIAGRQGYFVAKNANGLSCVHSIYSGDTSGPEIAEVVALITKRCLYDNNYKQVIPGNVGFESAASYLSEDIYHREKRVITTIDDDNNIISTSEYEYKIREILYLGISKTTSIPGGIRFTATENNYLLYAGDRKITKVLTNAVVQTARETLHKPAQIFYVATDFADAANRATLTRELVQYRQSYPEVFEGRLEVIKDMADTIELILFLSKLCIDRKTAIDDPTVDRDTEYFLYMNKMDWLFDEDLVRKANTYLADRQQESVEEAPAEPEDDEPMSQEELAELLALTGGEEMLAQAQSFDEKKAKAAVGVSGGVTVDALANAIYTILKEGTGNNIYAIMGFNHNKAFTKLASLFNFSNIKDYKQVVLGSFDMLETGKVDEIKEPKGTCYSGDENVVLRLYDFSLPDAKAFWQQLQEEQARKGAPLWQS